jgi:hypothetical protein
MAWHQKNSTNAAYTAVKDAVQFRPVCQSCAYSRCACIRLALTGMASIVPTLPSLVNSGLSMHTPIIGAHNVGSYIATCSMITARARYVAYILKIDPQGLFFYFFRIWYFFDCQSQKKKVSVKTFIHTFFN